jgi:hypothetical protein
MIATFFLIPESFAHNIEMTTEEIEQKTKALSMDFSQIKKHKDSNKLYVHENIYNVVFIEDITIMDLLYTLDISERKLDRDLRVQLQKIISESENTSYSTEEVIEVLINDHTEDYCHGLIAFNQVDEISPAHQIVYNFRGWLDFRRHFLQLYPGTATYFIEECVKYFPNLIFHARNKTTIGSILDDCSKKIIYHLTALNDNFRTSQQQGLNRTQVLARFSAENNLDETASLEGDASRKPAFTFIFNDDHNMPVKVCCEPHLKLCYNDNYPGDNHYSNNRRLYFHEGLPEIAQGKILIGHIGAHL